MGDLSPTTVARIRAAITADDEYQAARKAEKRKLAKSMDAVRARMHLLFMETQVSLLVEWIERKEER